MYSLKKIYNGLEILATKYVWKDLNLSVSEFEIWILDCLPYLLGVVSVVYTFHILSHNIVQVVLLNE